MKQELPVVRKRALEKRVKALREGFKADSRAELQRASAMGRKKVGIRSRDGWS